ncbi:hypothetical protein [Listeria phage LP-KV022]|uniref:Uncharacterized protein n=2 Tax=Homburgvirus LP110 TaxID=1921128 RepID=A0A5A4K1J1_9CAUD|nr:hypothetical protein LP110_050 [Listeria phage LP-110]AGI11553.1 hypothetical protein LP110_050 [Listeria phage LP-110]AWY07743.1 hypothetical protein [Listeria phage LP-KV022]
MRKDNIYSCIYTRDGERVTHIRLYKKPSSDEILTMFKTVSGCRERYYVDEPVGYAVIQFVYDFKVK